MGDGEMRADLDALAAASEGTVSVSDLDEGPAPGPEAGPSRAASLSCRRHSRGVPAPLVTTSFSRLVGGESSRSAEEGLDRDATGGMDRPTPGPGEAGGRRVTLADLEPGARAGNCFHEIFETIDFEGGSGEIRAEVERRLARHGFDPRAWTEPATRAVADALATEIDPASPGLSLSRVPASRRLTEIDLLVPAAIDRGRAVAPGALAAAFAALGHVPDGYAESVSRLGFAPFRGFVKGFADLVFVHGDRWYLVDYKTNHLGDLLDDYRPEALERAMAEHHYYLQYHLYALALHRYLGRRLAGYDYGTHFGGAIYLFLRGMCPEEEDRYGVFRDLPDPDLIEGMSALLDGDARGVTP